VSQICGRTYREEIDSSMFGSLSQLKDAEPVGMVSILTQQRLIECECCEELTRFVTKKIPGPH
jgi:hypothetical protein